MDAVVDIGTNSIRLLIAERERTEHGSYYRPVAARLKITWLGQNVNETGLLDQQAVARTCRVLEEYREELRRYPVERLVVAATSAVRDGINRDEFLEQVKSLTGWDVRILTGDEEAAASFIGAVKTMQSLGFALSPEVLVLDIGGGSAELTSGTAGGRIIAGGSVQAGAVRMTELCVTKHPVGADELGRLRSAIASRIAGLAAALPDLETKRTLIGVGGTITTLTALELGLAAYDWAKVTGTQLARERVAYWLHHLAGLTLAERAAIPGLGSGREEIIVAGAAICHGVMELVGADQLVASDADLMQGLLYSLD